MHPLTSPAASKPTHHAARLRGPELGNARRKAKVAACLLATMAAGLVMAPGASWAQAGARAGTAAASTATTEVAGIAYPAQLTVAGQTLALNGAGVRYRFVVRVYTAGLYLGTTARTPQAVMDAPGPKRLHVVMLRDIDANQLGRLFTRGMQDNVPRAGFSKFIPGTLRMSEIFSTHKRLKAGESFSVDYVPGVGTTVLVNGRPAAEPITEPEFFNGLISIWLGERPADIALKDALLGLQTAASGQN
jgi:hypothetical protein